MAETALTLAGSMRFREVDDVPVEGVEGLLMYQRTARKPTTTTATICGMLIELSAAMTPSCGWCRVGDADDSSVRGKSLFSVDVVFAAVRWMQTAQILRQEVVGVCVCVLYKCGLCQRSLHPAA